MERKDVEITPHKGGRETRYGMRMDNEDKKLMFDMAKKRGFKSVADYVLSLVKKDAKRK